MFLKLLKRKLIKKYYRDRLIRAYLFFTLIEKNSEKTINLAKKVKKFSKYDVNVVVFIF